MVCPNSEPETNFTLTHIFFLFVPYKKKKKMFKYVRRYNNNFIFKLNQWRVRNDVIFHVIYYYNLIIIFCNLESVLTETPSPLWLLAKTLCVCVCVRVYRGLDAKTYNWKYFTFVLLRQCRNTFFRFLRGEIFKYEKLWCHWYTFHHN